MLLLCTEGKHIFQQSVNLTIRIKNLIVFVCPFLKSKTQHYYEVGTVKVNFLKLYVISHSVMYWYTLKIINSKIKLYSALCLIWFFFKDAFYKGAKLRGVFVSSILICTVNFRILTTWVNQEMRTLLILVIVCFIVGDALAKKSKSVHCDVIMSYHLKKTLKKRVFLLKQ